MRRYASTGTPVTVSSGQNVQVKLTQQKVPQYDALLAILFASYKMPVLGATDHCALRTTVEYVSSTPPSAVVGVNAAAD